MKQLFLHSKSSPTPLLALCEAHVGRAGVGLFKKWAVTLAIALATTAGAWAQSSGTYTLTNGQNYTSNITLTGNVTYNVASGYVGYY